MNDSEAGAARADGSTTAQVALDDEAKQLQLQQAKAEARKAIAEADRARLKAALPESTIKPLEGKVDVSEKSGFVAELAAYAVLDQAAKRIVDALPGAKTVLMVEDRNLVASDWPYALVRDQLNGHVTTLVQAEKALAGVAGPARTDGLAALAVAPIAVPALIGAAAELVGMLRADYAFTGRPVTVSTTALIAAVAARLAERPSATAIVDGFSVVQNSGILADLGKLRTKKAEVESSKLDLDETHIAPLQRQFDETTALIDATEKGRLKAMEDGKPTAAFDERLTALRSDRSAVEDQLAPLKAVTRKVQAALDDVATFLTAAVAAPEHGYAPIVAAALRERLHLEGDQAVTHVLYLSAGPAGGETIARRSLWTTRLAFIGGCQLSYLVFDVVANKTTIAGSSSWTAHVRYDLRSNEVGPVVVRRFPTSPG